MDNSLSLFLMLFTSIVSSYYVFEGLKKKKVSRILLGIGLGVPALGISEVKYWWIAGVVCTFALWLGTQLGD